jgi:hypothetical protein
LLDDRRIRIRDAKKLPDPTNPDPDYCFEDDVIVILLLGVHSCRQGNGPKKGKTRPLGIFVYSGLSKYDQINCTM